MAVGHRRWRAHAGHGSTRGPSGGAGLGPRLRSAVSDGRVSGVSNRLTDPLWALGAVATPPGQRAIPQAALAAPPPAPLCASGKDGAAPAPGARDAPRGVRHAGGGPTGARGGGLADEDVHRRGAPRWLKEDQDPRADRTVKSCVTQFSMRV